MLKGIPVGDSEVRRVAPINVVGLIKGVGQTRAVARLGPPTDSDVQNSRIRLFRRMVSLHDGRKVPGTESAAMGYSH
jgi:hypothetical protein